MKKLKKIGVLFCIISIYQVNLFAQQCGTVIDHQKYQNEINNIIARKLNRQAIVPDDTTKYVINLHFNIIKSTNGTVATSTENFNIDDIMDEVMILNTHFNPFNIFFKYNGLRIIKNDNLLRMRYEGHPGTILSQPTYQAYDAYLQSLPNYNFLNEISNIQIFVVDYISEQAASPNIRYYGGQALSDTLAFIVGTQLKTKTLLHEIGHCLGLYHTFQGYNATGCELVSGFNSQTAGDLVEDTPADHPGALIDQNTCIQYVDPNIKDCMDTPYDNCPKFNIMSYSTCAKLATNLQPSSTAVFTPKQVIKMREKLQNSATLSYGLVYTFNTVQSLYEPYEKTPNLGGIASITDDGIANGMSVVCRNLTDYTYKFQKGFNYTFNRFGQTINVPVNQLPVFNDFGNFNISQLNPSYFKEFGQTCYKGAVLCNLEPISGGKIYTVPVIGGSVYSV